jgi:hypothetical protein
MQRFYSRRHKVAARVCSSAFTKPQASPRPVVGSAVRAPPTSCRQPCRRRRCPRRAACAETERVDLRFVSEERLHRARTGTKANGRCVPSEGRVAQRRTRSARVEGADGQPTQAQRRMEQERTYEAACARRVRFLLTICSAEVPPENRTERRRLTSSVPEHVQPSSCDSTLGASQVGAAGAYARRSGR